MDILGKHCMRTNSSTLASGTVAGSSTVTSDVSEPCGQATAPAQVQAAPAGTLSAFEDSKRQRDKLLLKLSAPHIDLTPARIEIQAGKLARRLPTVSIAPAVQELEIAWLKKGVAALPRADLLRLHARVKQKPTETNESGMALEGGANASASRVLMHIYRAAEQRIVETASEVTGLADSEVSRLGRAVHGEVGPLQLDKAVVVMRHGVRGPLYSAEIQRYSGKSWPAWPVADGQLTEHGYQALVRLGEYLRCSLRAQGSVSEPSWPTPADVFIWSSPKERSRASAAALLEGMFPGDRVPVHFTSGKYDPLFHPNKSDAVTVDLDQARTAILKVTGGSIEAGKVKYAAPIKALEDIVGVPSEQPGRCRLSAMKWQIKQKANELTLDSPLVIGGKMTETFRMQYANGMPLDRVAFGHGRTAVAVADLTQLHCVQQRLRSEDWHLASRRGSQMLNEILLALGDEKTEPRSEPRTGADTDAVAEAEAGAAAVEARRLAKLLVYSGHDKNLEALATLLDFHWQVAEYQPDDSAPGGCLMFERLVECEGERRFVRVSYLAQSLDQIRELAELSEASPPYRAGYADPRWRGEGDGTLLPLERFTNGIAHLIDDSATLPQRYDRSRIETGKRAADAP